MYKALCTSLADALVTVKRAIQHTGEVSLVNVSGTEAGYLVEFDDGAMAHEELLHVTELAESVEVERWIGRIKYRTYTDEMLTFALADCHATLANVAWDVNHPYGRKLWAEIDAIRDEQMARRSIEKAVYRRIKAGTIAA